MPELNLQNPNAPTRLSGHDRRNLSAWSKRTMRRLPAIGALHPFHGKIPVLPNGKRAFMVDPILPVNDGLRQLPMVPLPPAVAKRAERVRREIRRQRLRDTGGNMLLVPGLSGLDFARGPRIVPGTPSLVRGRLRDINRPIHGAKFYTQGVAPASSTAKIIEARQLTAPADLGTVAGNPAPDRKALAEGTAALRYAAGAAAIPSPPAQVVPASSMLAGILPLVAVVAMAWILVRGAR